MKSGFFIHNTTEPCSNQLGLPNWNQNQFHSWLCHTFTQWKFNLKSDIRFSLNAALLSVIYMVFFAEYATGIVFKNKTPSSA